MSRARVYPIFIRHAGCPFRCDFCNQAVSAPQPVQFDAVHAELAAMLPASGDGEIAFYGGSFTLLPPAEQEALLQQATSFISAGHASGIRLSTRPDGLEGRQLQLLQRYPVTTIEVGCQSFSDMVLRRSHRGYGRTVLQGGLERLFAERHCRIGLQLMPGLPGGDRVEALASLSAALQFRPDFVRIYPALVLAGTQLEASFRAGDYQPLELEPTLDLGARMTAMCQLAQVSIERFGLPGESSWNQEETGLIAGPYHPSLGQRVKTRLWRQLVERRLQPQDATLTVPGRLLSDVVGHRRENVIYFAVSQPQLQIVGSTALPETEFRLDNRIYHWHQELQEYLKDDDQ